MTTRRQQPAKRRPAKQPANGAKPNLVTLEDAMAVLQQEQRERVQECQAEIAEPMKQVNEIIAKHNCLHLVYVQLKSNTWVPVTDLGELQNVRLVVSPNAQRG